MLIITADDYGKNKNATDNILKCFLNKRISSASAMVFMEDSERAAQEALKSGLEIGLHLNFTMPFNSCNIDKELQNHQNEVISYLSKNKVAQIIYNPFLADSFKFLFLAQQEEFMRLYGRHPDFYNGHHHMHLCANMLIRNLIPKGARVRGTFTFESGEKSLFNLLYRKCLTLWISSRFHAPHGFFSIVPVQDFKRLENIINRAVRENIELEVHPENAEEIEFLLSDQYKALIDTVPIGCFGNL